MFITIGKLAKKANVTVETIRYYQRKGLLCEPEKPANGYRQYPIDDITRIRFIKHVQQCGFTLKEISELLFLDNGHCQDVQKIAKQKSQQINQQIKDLIVLQNVLDSLIEGCQGSQSTEGCSFIDTIFSQSQNPESSN
ncbi:MAG: MerR family transcriptional regulator [Methylococcales bacterium]|jgi:MerR family mercuric resistance operon transcriptional regulator|nr:MerR family transcriptional regulator [Methylococcales bacterium]